MQTGGWVYIMTNRRGGALYVGVTADLPRRVAQHRTGALPGFTRRYNLTRLVHAESHAEIAGAIAREKALKRWPRAWKLALIEAGNPAWDDLWETLLNGGAP